MASYVEKLVERAQGALKAGRVEEARAALEKAAGMEPSNAGVMYLWGVARRAGGDLVGAVGCFEKAVRLGPGVGVYRFELGYTLMMAGRGEEALGVAAACAAGSPNDARAQLLVGAVLSELGRYGEAEGVVRGVVGRWPGNVDAMMNLGVICGKLGRHGEAVGVFENLAGMRPGDAGVWSNLGLAYSAAGKVEEAVGAFEKARSIAPGSAAVLSNLGIVLELAGRLEEAIEVYKAAVGAEGGNAGIYSNYLVALRRAGGRGEEEVLEAHVEFGGRVGGAGEGKANAEHRTSNAQRRSEDTAGRAGHGTGDAGKTGEGGVLRVGYVSSDFRRHAVASFFVPLMEGHDGGRVHVTCYSGTEVGDEVTGRIRGLAGGWRDIRGVSDEGVVRMIGEDGIDVLVDLSGHSAGNRLQLFARRAAAVQVSYLGYPNTTGVREMDYYLTDAVVDPVGMTERWFTERLWRLQRCCWCYRPVDEAPAVAGLPADRNGVVTFGSFHPVARLNAEVIRVWAGVMRRAGRARLLVARDGMSEGVCRRIREAFEGHGVEGSRLEVRGVAAGKAMELYGEVDVLLDTFPWSGHTTACDALWMGVPVVTWAGRTHASRMVAGVLAAVGLTDLVADGEEGFVEVAGKLAEDAGRVRELRGTLRERVRGSELGDGRGLAREVERAFGEMWWERIRK